MTTALALAQVCAGVYPDVTTKELDDLAAETAAYMSTGTRRRQSNARANSCPALRALPIGKYWAGAGSGAGEPGAGRRDAASAACRRGGLLDRG